MDARHPDETFLRGIDIHTLLPQQEPFVMVGAVTAYDDSGITTETMIAEDNIFVDEGEFSSTGLMENIAQTCAARIGYVNKYILLRGIQLGFIGAVRKMEVLGHPKVGDTIVTEVIVKEDVFGVILADATVRCCGEVLVTTEIKLAVKEVE